MDDLTKELVAAECSTASKILKDLKQERSTEIDQIEAFARILNKINQLVRSSNRISSSDTIANTPDTPIVTNTIQSGAYADMDKIDNLERINKLVRSELTLDGLDEHVRTLFSDYAQRLLVTQGKEIMQIVTRRERIMQRNIGAIERKLKHLTKLMNELVHGTISSSHSDDAPYAQYLSSAQPLAVDVVLQLINQELSALENIAVSLRAYGSLLRSAADASQQDEVMENEQNTLLIDASDEQAQDAFALLGANGTDQLASSTAKTTFDSDSTGPQGATIATPKVSNTVATQGLRRLSDSLEEFGSRPDHDQLPSKHSKHSDDEHERKVQTFAQTSRSQAFVSHVGPSTSASSTSSTSSTSSRHGTRGRGHKWPKIESSVSTKTCDVRDTFASDPRETRSDSFASWRRFAAGGSGAATNATNATNAPTAPNEAINVVANAAAATSAVTGGELGLGLGAAGEEVEGKDKDDHEYRTSSCGARAVRHADETPHKSETLSAAAAQRGVRDRARARSCSVGPGPRTRGDDAVASDDEYDYEFEDHFDVQVAGQVRESKSDSGVVCVAENVNKSVKNSNSLQNGHEDYSSDGSDGSVGSVGSVGSDEVFCVTSKLSSMGPKASKQRPSSDPTDLKQGEGKRESGRRASIELDKDVIKALKLKEGAKMFKNPNAFVSGARKSHEKVAVALESVTSSEDEMMAAMRSDVDGSAKKLELIDMRSVGEASGGWKVANEKSYACDMKGGDAQPNYSDAKE